MRRNPDPTPERERLAADPFPVVLAGPSGSGKTTIGRQLVELRSDIRFSISATTRDARPGEADGEDYHFMDRTEFERLRDEDGFLEWAEVHGALYGTPRSNFLEAREAGEKLLLDIDVQGARSVRGRLDETVSIFVVPPSGDEILRRLRGRGTEDTARLRRRLRSAESELAAMEEFDYLVVNDRLREAVSRVEAIVDAESSRIERLGESVQVAAEEFVDEIHRAAASGESAAPGEVDEA